MRPASICPARLCQHISEQGTAGSLRPPAGSPCCNHASKEAWVLRQGPGVEMWPPRRSARGQPSPRRQSPPCPAPGAQHRASPSPLLPARPVARQTFARPVQAKGSLAQPGPRGWLGSSYLRPRGFAEPPPPAGLAPSSGRRFSVAAAAAAAAPCPPVTRETASPSLPPTNQHRSHGASKPMGDLGIPVLFQGPEPLPRLRDQTGRQGSH